MSNSKPRVKLTGIGILSRLAVMHYYTDQAGIDVRAVKEEDRVVDVSAGIEITHNLKLRLASKEDAEFLAVFPISIESIIQYSLNDYVLEYSLDANDDSKSVGEASDKIRRMINSTVLAFRMLKPGYVDSNVILWITQRGKDKHPSLMAEKTIRAHPLDHYRLRIDELTKLTDLVQKVFNVDSARRRSLHIALDRFNRSYYEIEDEDKLIDFMIAFEALYLEGEGRFQHAIVPVACAMLLGQTPEERYEIRNLLNLAYEVRNSIVHSSDYRKKLRKKELELEDLINDVEEILRGSLRKLI